MWPEPIDNEHLRLSDVPEESADWASIQRFALRFDGYQAHGSFQKCAAIANKPRHDTLTDLRTCLFFEQRRWRHFGEHPDDKAMAYIRSLVEQIRTTLAMRGQG